MKLPSLSLLAKASVGVGVVGLAGSIPFVITNKGAKQTEEKQAPNTFTEESKNKEILEEISKRNCEEAYRSKKEGELGALYVCPFSTERTRPEGGDSSKADVGELWYLKDDKTLETPADKRNISELFKKVVSLTYKGNESKEGHITFSLDGEEEERKFIVNSGDSWQYFSTSARFSEMETLLSSIYKKSP